MIFTQFITNAAKSEREYRQCKLNFLQYFTIEMNQNLTLALAKQILCFSTFGA